MTVEEIVVCLSMLLASQLPLNGFPTECSVFG